MSHKCFTWSRSVFIGPDCRPAQWLGDFLLYFHSGHIPSLLKADLLDPAMTRLVAINSIYFKGLWKSCFKPENTKMRPFHTADGSVSKVPMMSQLSLFNIGEKLWQKLSAWCKLKTGQQDQSSSPWSKEQCPTRCHLGYAWAIMKERNMKSFILVI